MVYLSPNFISSFTPKQYHFTFPETNSCQRCKSSFRKATSTLTMNINKPLSPTSPETDPKASVSPLPQKSASEATSMTQTVDPLETRIRAELHAEGVSFDDLLDGARVLSLARRLETLNAQLKNETTADKTTLMRTRQKIQRLQAKYQHERTLVMSPLLKNVFIYQAILLGLIGGVLSFDGIPPFYQKFHFPYVARALGFWMIWLFSIPALRARKGMGSGEKAALNWAFLVIPLVNVVIPSITKDFGAIWTVDTGILGACYVYFVGIRGGGKDVLDKAPRIKGMLRWLDWGSWR